MAEGKVKWFDPKKGFGFISREKDKLRDIFVHFSGIAGNGYRTLTDGEEVTFDEVEGPEGIRAVNVVKVNNPNVAKIIR